MRMRTSLGRSQGLLPGRDAGNLSSRCMQGWHCWHQTLVRKNQSEEREGWREAIRGIPLLSKGPLPPCLPHILEKMISPSIPPTAPPYHSSPTQSHARDPITACVHNGDPNQKGVSMVPDSGLCIQRPSHTTGWPPACPPHVPLYVVLMVHPHTPDTPTYHLSKASGSRWWGLSQQWCPAHPGQRPHHTAHSPEDQKAAHYEALEKTGSSSVWRLGQWAPHPGELNGVWDETGETEAWKIEVAQSENRLQRSPSREKALPWVYPFSPPKGSRCPRTKFSPQ